MIPNPAQQHSLQYYLDNTKFIHIVDSIPIVDMMGLEKHSLGKADEFTATLEPNRLVFTHTRGPVSRFGKAVGYCLVSDTDVLISGEIDGLQKEVSVSVGYLFTLSVFDITFPLPVYEPVSSVEDKSQWCPYCKTRSNSSLYRAGACGTCGGSYAYD